MGYFWGYNEKILTFFYKVLIFSNIQHKNFFIFCLTNEKKCYICIVKQQRKQTKVKQQKLTTMRKIEKKMIEAIKNGKEFKETNTYVFTTKNGIFVKLYNTIIFALVDGNKYYSDGGYATVTTSSRLRALGADYSTNDKKNKTELQTQKFMYNLI